MNAKITMDMNANGPNTTVPPTAKPPVVKKATRNNENEKKSAITP